MANRFPDPWFKLDFTTRLERAHRLKMQTPASGVYSCKIRTLIHLEAVGKAPAYKKRIWPLMVPYPLGIGSVEVWLN